MLLVRLPKKGLPLARKMPPGSNNILQEAPRQQRGLWWRESRARASRRHDGCRYIRGRARQRHGCGYPGPGPTSQTALRLWLPGPRPEAGLVEIKHGPRCTALPPVPSSLPGPLPLGPQGACSKGGEPLPLSGGISSREAGSPWDAAGTRGPGSPAFASFHRRQTRESGGGSHLS